MDWGAKTFRHCTMHSWPISRIEVVPSYDTCCDLAIVQKISSHLIVCVYTVNVHHIKRAILQFRKCCIASVVRGYWCNFCSFWRARVTLARISAALAVQTNGLGD